MSRAEPLSKQDEAPATPHYDSSEERKRLLAILIIIYLAMLKAMNDLVIARFDLDPEQFGIDDAAQRRMAEIAAHRVVRIDDTTRRAIAASLHEGAARGYSNWQIAYGVPEDHFAGINGLFRETWKARAEMVARTELIQAQRAAALQRYVASGMVDRVQVVDGCMWDKPCCDRNGKIVPIEHAPTLNHPNCTLLLIPVLRHGILEGEGEESRSP